MHYFKLKNGRFCNYGEWVQDNDWKERRFGVKKPTSPLESFENLEYYREKFFELSIMDKIIKKLRIPEGESTNYYGIEINHDGTWSSGCCGGDIISYHKRKLKEHERLAGIWITRQVDIENCD